MFKRHRSKAESTEDNQRRTCSCQAGDESRCQRDFICRRGTFSDLSCKASPASSLRPGSEADNNDRRQALGLHHRSQQRRQPLGLPDPGEEGHLRLILCPDEGGPLWSAYQFLAHSGAAIGFRRDELFFACMLTNCYADMQHCMRVFILLEDSEAQAPRLLRTSHGRRCQNQARLCMDIMS